jgi:WhiB family redox-sensing transcriptional regulator
MAHVETTSMIPTAELLDTNWSQFGACIGRTDLFFPPRAERPQARERREAKAKVICGSCSVSWECRWYGRLNREYGFWGGESEAERAEAGYSVPAPIGGRGRSRRTIECVSDDTYATAQ